MTVRCSRPTRRPRRDPGRRVGVEQGYQSNLFALRLQLASHFISDHTPKTETTQIIGTFRLVRADRLHIAGCHLGDGGVRLDLAVQTLGLQANKRLVGAKRLGKVVQIDDLPTEVMHTEEGRQAAALLDDDDGRPIHSGTGFTQIACQARHGGRLE